MSEYRVIITETLKRAVIAERSGVMAEKLKAVREDAQKQQQKEEQQHEHIRRRS